MNSYFLSIAHHLSTVTLSIFIAVLATYVALDLAGRVHRAFDRVATALWIAAGSIAMGSGIWAMHFVGMASAVYPFAAAYELGLTGASWIAAVAVCSVLLAVAGRQEVGAPLVLCASVLAGIGGTAMHYVGASALVVTPAVIYDLRWTALAVLVASVGTFVALRMFIHLRELAGLRRIMRQIAAAFVFGGSLAAMHYLAMASADFAVGSICLSQTGLDVNQLGTAVGFSSATFLLLMLLMTTLSRRAEARSQLLNGSLEKVQDELRFVTLNDVATGLPNRLIFQDRLKQAVAACDREGRSILIMLIELEGFKALSHSLSEAEADRVLRQAADRLSAIVRASDTVASIGGDQFLVMLHGVEAAIRVASEITAASRRPFIAGHHEVSLSASVGMTVYPADGAASSLVTNAGIALEAVKHDGGNGYRFFEERMNAEALARLGWLSDLRMAVQLKQFELHYQPKVHAQSGRISGVEALLRWRHPKRGMVSPAVFIPLAEQFGLINDIGAWIIEAACRQMSAWRSVGVEMQVAINISALQLRQPNLASDIAMALRHRGIDPSLLTCEITESAAMQDTESTLEVFKRLAAEGVQISIDDFGTGYSSLSYLRRFPMRQVKVDRSFVQDVGDSDDARAIVAAIIELAHSLRLEVVAEGVETLRQRDVLIELGCDKFQGFLFARPMPVAALNAMLSDENGRAETFRDSVFARSV